MLSIQSIMLVTLGFLTALLLALTFAPAFWSRAVRLTTQRIKERLPITETEIRADKDRLRAEYAMTVHRLEAKIEQADMKRARHLIDLNRRDASITQLESEVTTLRASVEEFQNARRVLEHTVSERLPGVEARLDQARILLETRDGEIHDLSQSTSRQQQALEEARGINAQQGAEIDRLSTSLTIRGGRNRQALADPSFSGEIALRAEIEGLRAKTREQQALIERLQRSPGLATEISGVSALLGANRSTTGGLDLPAGLMGVLPPDEVRAGLERELRSLKSKSEDQSAEIKTMAAELAALRSADAANTPDSKVALRARLMGLQTQTEQQTELVRKLRAELSAANERLALQGAHFMEQMRKLGAGSLPASGQGRRLEAVAPKISLAERVANSRGPQASSIGASSVASAASDSSSVSPNDAASVPDASASSLPAASVNTSPRLIDRISSLSKV